jgi:phosphatidylglycerol---prolipoprotein diacylglyceryl transferase
MTVYPLIIHLGGLTLTGYGIMMMTGFLLSGWVYSRELVRRGLDSAIAWDTVVAAVVGGLVGSKVYYAASVGRIGALFARGGLVWYGGLAGGAAFVLGYIWIKKLPLRTILDAIAPSLVTGYMIGRVGCFSVNDDYGLPSRLPWAVAFPQGSPPTTARNLAGQFHAVIAAGTPPDQVLTVHPTELYEIALSLLIFWLLWRWRQHRHAPGWLFGVYLILTSLERILVEIVRAKDDRFFAGITVAQVVGLFLVLVGMLVVVRFRRPVDGSVAPPPTTA